MVAAPLSGILEGGNMEHHPQTTQVQEIKIVTSWFPLGGVCYRDIPWCTLTDTLPFSGLKRGVCPGSFWKVGGGAATS